MLSVYFVRKVDDPLGVVRERFDYPSFRVGVFGREQLLVFPTLTRPLETSIPEV